MAKDKLEKYHPLAQERSEFFCLEVREPSQRPTLLSPLESTKRGFEQGQRSTAVDDYCCARFIGNACCMHLFGRVSDDPNIVELFRSALKTGTVSLTLI